MTRATWALRAIACVWFVAAVAVWVYLAVFLSSLPEPVEWVPASDPQPAPASARCRCGECDGTGQRW